MSWLHGKRCYSERKGKVKNNNNKKGEKRLSPTSLLWVWGRSPLMGLGAAQRNCSCKCSHPVFFFLVPFPTIIKFPNNYTSRLNPAVLPHAAILSPALWCPQLQPPPSPWHASQGLHSLQPHKTKMTHILRFHHHFLLMIIASLYPSLYP